MTADVYSHLYERDDPAKAAALDAAYTATGTTNVVPLSVWTRTVAGGGDIVPCPYCG